MRLDKIPFSFNTGWTAMTHLHYSGIWITLPFPIKGAIVDIIDMSLGHLRVANHFMYGIKQITNNGWLN